MEHEQGWEAETMRWSNPDEEPDVKTVIVSEDRAVRTEAIRWPTDSEPNVGAGVWMWRTEGSQSNDGRGGSSGVCKHGDCWNTFCSHLGTRRIEVYDAELWAIGLVLTESVRKRDTLQTHGVTKVAVFSDLQVAIRQLEHLDLGPGKPLVRWINRRARTLRKASVEPVIHCVPGHTGIPGTEETDCQAILV
jgi:hypothetical protein